MLMMSMDADDNMGSCDNEDDDGGDCGGVSDDADGSNNDEDALSAEFSRWRLFVIF